MYIPDLSNYQVLSEPPCLTVGWLGESQPYPQGVPPSLFIDRLWEFCKVPVHGTLGIHDCELCQPPITIYRVERAGEIAFLGTAEIRVFGSEAKVYAAPTLIYHYVLDHQYLPPEEFIQAVLAGPLPSSAEYQMLIQTIES
jgi:hypothetical protein